LLKVFFYLFFFNYIRQFMFKTKSLSIWGFPLANSLASAGLQQAKGPHPILRG